MDFLILHSKVFHVFLFLLNFQKKCIKNSDKIFPKNLHFISVTFLPKMNKNKNCQKLEIIGVLRSLIKVSIEKYEKKKCKCEKSDFENDRK